MVRKFSSRINPLPQITCHIGPLLVGASSTGEASAVERDTTEAPFTRTFRISLMACGYLSQGRELLLR